MSQPIKPFVYLMLITLTALPVMADPPSFLSFQEDIPLNGGISRFEHQAIDPSNHLLYISHTGAGQIIILNTEHKQIINTISGLPGVSGLLVLPDIHRLYACEIRLHQVAVIDTNSQKVIAHIPAGHQPDGMAYVPELHQLYVTDETGGEETVIDVLKNKKLGSIVLDGVAGDTRYDNVAHWIWTVVSSKNELVSIDPQTRKVLKRYAIKAGKDPHGLWIEADSRLAFIACDKDNKLVVMDLKTFQETGISDLGKDPDVIAFDQQLGYLYAASESGTLSAFRIRDRKVEKLGDAMIGNEAHSVEVNPLTHEVYFPLRQVGKLPVLRVMKPSN
jgi:YVTN family beta-propeller protein